MLKKIQKQKTLQVLLLNTCTLSHCQTSAQPSLLAADLLLSQAPHLCSGPHLLTRGSA